ncbi:MAG: hypothetical protein IJD79_09955 [Clostridia bacterium]|nr:hypothetical protein [Clostridia bacterium]
MEDKLTPIIKELMRTKMYVVFLIGRNGEFDECAASILKRVRKESGEENSEIILVLPYTVANIEYYEKYYDDIIIPDRLYSAHPKSAIILRNRWMIESSDLVVVYVEHKTGGAYTAMKYAEKLNKRIINIY